MFCWYESAALANISLQQLFVGFLCTNFSSDSRFINGGSKSTHLNRIVVLCKFGFWSLPEALERPISTHFWSVCLYKVQIKNQNKNGSSGCLLTKNRAEQRRIYLFKELKMLVINVLLLAFDCRWPSIFCGKFFTTFYR